MREALSHLRLMPSVERPEPMFSRGQGSWLWDRHGEAYLDFTQGWAVNSLGHSPVVVVDALKRQAEQLLNPGPAYYNRGMLKLASRLCQVTDSDQAYFVCSGAEANEAAIKLARKWGQRHRQGAYRIISARNSFHGRSLATMSLSGKPSFSEQFEPKVDGFDKVPFNDIDALQAAITEQTVAIMLEPVQGQAGVIPATLEYLQTAERLCRQHGLLLILDEIQTGIGRCGSLLAEDLYGIRADVITLGKGLGGGVPLGAILARGNACCMEADELGGTFHGHALMTTAGLAVLNTVLESGFMEQVRTQSQYLREGLARVARRHGHGPLRGHGLLIGLPLIHQPAAQVVQAALAEHLLINAPQPDCLRLSPALTVSRASIDEMLRRLDRALAHCRSNEVSL